MAQGWSAALPPSSSLVLIRLVTSLIPSPLSRGVLPHRCVVRGTGNIPREELSTALGGENALLASVTSSSLSSLNITSRTTLYHTSLTNSPL